MTFTKTFSIGCAVAAWLGTSAAVVAADMPTFICNPFPPQKIESGNSNNLGYDVDILKEALARQGRDVSFVFAPWARAYKLATSPDASGLCSCSFREDRIKDFLFSDELGEVSIGFFSRKPTLEPYRSLEDLKGVNVAVIRGYNLSQELKEKGVEHTQVNSEYNLARMLAAGRIDVAFSYRDAFLYYAKQADITEEFSYVQLRKSPYYVCVNKLFPDAEVLRNAINVGLDALKADGTFEAIKNKYTQAVQ